MLRWAMVFFVLTLVTALFGFGGLLASSAGAAAQWLFYPFLIVFLVSLVIGLTGRRPAA